MFSSQFSSAARIPQRLNSPAAPSTKQGKIWEEKQTSFVFVNSLKRDNRREYIRLWVHLFELVASSRGHCMSSNRCVPVFLSGNDPHRCWLCSSSQHIAPSGHRSLASVDGKGQVWLADASLHTSTDFGSPPPQAPVNQELMKGYLRHMRHLARVSTHTSLFIPLLWKFIFLFSLCCQFMSLKGGLRRRIIRLLKPLCIREVISPVCCSQWGLSDENHYVSEPWPRCDCLP